MLVNKAYKVRIYPNKKQTEELVRIVGACRYVWNYYLEARKGVYLEKKKLSYAEMARDLTKLRHTTEWMKGIQAEPLQQSLRMLDVAYSRFFRKEGDYPKFKNKKDNRQTFRKHQDFRLLDKKIQIQADLIIKYRGQLPTNTSKMGTLTVSRESTGKWYASVQVTEEVKPKKTFTKPIGIDVGLKHLAISSNGDKFDSLELGYDERLNKLHQKLSQAIRGSNRRGKLKVQSHPL